MIHRPLLRVFLSIAMLFYGASSVTAQSEGQFGSSRETFAQRWPLVAGEMRAIKYRVDTWDQVIRRADIGDEHVSRALAIVRDAGQLGDDSETEVVRVVNNLRETLLRQPGTVVESVGQGLKFSGYPSRMGVTKTVFSARTFDHSLEVTEVELDGDAKLRRSLLNTSEFSVFFSEDLGTVQVFSARRYSSGYRPIQLLRGVSLYHTTEQIMSLFVESDGVLVNERSKTAMRTTRDGLPLHWTRGKTAATPKVLTTQRICDDLSMLGGGIFADRNGIIFPIVVFHVDFMDNEDQDLVSVSVSRITEVEKPDKEMPLTMCIPTSVRIADYTVQPNESFEPNPAKWPKRWSGLLAPTPDRTLLRPSPSHYAALNAVKEPIPEQDDDRSSTARFRMIILSAFLLVSAGFVIVSFRGRRKHRAATVGTLFLSASLACLSGCGRPAPQEATFKDLVVDFGRLRPDQPELTAEFSLENPTGSDCVIDRATVSCACLGGTEAPFTIPARTKVPYVIRMDVGNQGGPVRHSARLYSSSFPRGYIDLTITADLQRDLLASPSQIDLGRLEPGQAVTREIILSAPGGRDVVLPKDPPTDGINVTIRTLYESRSPQFSAMVRFTAPKDRGPFKYRLGFERRGEKPELIEVPLIGEVVGGLAVSQAFMRLKADEERSCRVKLASVAGLSEAADLRNLEVRELPDGITSTIVEVSPREWSVTFRSSRDAKTGIHRVEMRYGDEVERIAVDVAQ